jgi:hypothetical protein
MACSRIVPQEQVGEMNPLPVVITTPGKRRYAKLATQNQHVAGTRRFRKSRTRKRRPAEEYGRNASE